MATVLSQILDRWDVLLKANVPVGCSVFRERTEAESRAEAPSVNVKPMEAAIESFSREMDVHQVTLEVRIYVRAEPPTPSAEVVHASFHGAVMDDATLQTLVESTRIEASSFNEVEADVTALDKTSRYRVTYLIPKNTL
jgi:hypothetical protein